MSEPVKYHVGEFPPTRLDWEAITPELLPAERALARYDALLNTIPNPAVFLTPLTTREALLSSKIEGTRATFGEVLAYEADGSPDETTPERKHDIIEILNYRRAMGRAEGLLETLPISLRVVRHIHDSLMQGARGQSRKPGEFRNTMVHIGPLHGPADDIRFIPAEVEDLQEGLTRWENYLHQDELSRIVQAGLAHAEFEALHPFLDGNGRVGRILVPILLWNYGLIHRPMFYLSEYLETHRETYYERLRAISRDGDWIGWTLFFVRAVRAQAEQNYEKVKQLLDLYEHFKPIVRDGTRSRFGDVALDWIFSRPIFTSTQFAASSNIPEHSARRILKILEQTNIVTVLRPGRGRRPAQYAFRDLLNTVEGEEVF